MPKLTRTEKEVRAADAITKVEKSAKVGKPGASPVTGDWLGQVQRLSGQGGRGGVSVPSDLPSYHRGDD